jgi:hypothetical protein
MKRPHVGDRSGPEALSRARSSIEGSGIPGAGRLTCWGRTPALGQRGGAVDGEAWLKAGVLKQRPGGFTEIYRLEGDGAFFCRRISIRISFTLGRPAARGTERMATGFA